MNVSMWEELKEEVQRRADSGDYHAHYESAMYDMIALMDKLERENAEATA